MQKAAFWNEFSEGNILSKELGGKKIALVKLKEQVFAFDDECTHEHFPLSDGFVEKERAVIECAYHGTRFDLHTGKVQALPATRPLKVYTTEIRGEEVWVDL